MALFFRRPLALFCVVFTLSLLFFSHTDSAAKIVFAVLSFLLFLLFLLLRCRRKMLLLALTVAALSAQLFGYLVFDQRLLPYRTAAEAGSDVFITATVEEITYTAAYGSAFYARVETLSGMPARGVIYVEAEEDPCVIVGSRVSFSAAVAIIDFRTEEGAYLAARGALARATVTKDVEVGAADPSLRYRFRRACTGQRTALARRLCTAVPGDTGELMAAMLLGERSLLSPEITRNFRRVGLSHVLALSGLHLGVLLSVVRWIFRHLRLPRRAEAPLSLLLLLGYLALTGFPVSVVRAGIMTGAATLAFPLRREADSITSLSLSAMLICLLRPAAVFDVGFYLTFAATLGVLVQGGGTTVLRKSAAAVRFPSCHAGSHSFYTAASGLVLWRSFPCCAADQPVVCAALFALFAAFVAGGSVRGALSAGTALCRDGGWASLSSLTHRHPARGHRCPAPSAFSPAARHLHSFALASAVSAACQAAHGALYRSRLRHRLLRLPCFIRADDALPTRCSLSKPKQ